MLRFNLYKRHFVSCAEVDFSRLSRFFNILMYLWPANLFAFFMGYRCKTVEDIRALRWDIILYRCIIKVFREIIIIWSYDSRNDTSTDEYPSRREFNIGGIHFQRCPGIMIHRERICPYVLFRRGAVDVVVVASGVLDAEKNSRHPLFLWFSYPNNYGGDGAGTYLDAEISFATYGKYFPKTRKASPNPCRVWYHCERWKFCRLSRLSSVCQHKEI